MFLLCRLLSYEVYAIGRIRARGRLAVGEEGVAHYLRHLPPCSVVVRTEVGQVARAARLVCRAAWIAAYITPACQALHPGVEAVGGGDVLEELPRRVVVEACGVGDYLRDLAPGSVVVGAEVWLTVRAARLVRPAARVPTDKAPARQALHPQEEAVGGWHVFEHLRPWLVAEARRVGHYLG